MKEKFPVTRLCGHDLQILPFSDGTARLTVDGDIAGKQACCEVAGIPEDTFDLFLRQYAKGKGEPVVFKNPTQAAICVICLAGYMNALEREKKPA